MTKPSSEVIPLVRGRLFRGLALAGVFTLFLNILQLINPLFMIQVYDRVLNSRSTDTLAMLAAVAVIALIIHGALDFLRSRIYHVMGESMGRALNRLTLQAAVRETLLGDPGRAALASRDLGELRGFITGNAISLPLEAMWSPLLLGVLFMMHPLYGLAGIGSAAVLVILSLINDRLCRPKMAEANAASAAAFGDVAAAVRNAEAIEAMGMLPAIARRWERDQRRSLRLLDDGNRTAKLISSISKSARMAMQIGILSVGVVLVIQRAASPGSMMAASIIMGRLLMPFEQLIDGWRQWVFALGAWKRVRDLLERGETRRGTMAFPSIEGRLSADRVVYVPPGTGRMVLKGLSFTLEAGKVLGIVGPSAAGKSTLARMLVGVLEPTGGGIYLDGHSVFQWDRENFGRHVGYLPQTVQLLKGTVRENIARMAEADPKDILTAARRADVHDMIGRLPFGYDTMVGEGGFSLSGGQRQRIGLARALFGQPRLLVLDEPNANLDAEGEQALLRAIAEMKRLGSTVVLIAHRPSLMTVADLLLVIKDGAVDQFGPQAEVLRRLTTKAVAEAEPAKVRRLVQPGDR